MAGKAPGLLERVDVFEYVDYRAFLRDYSWCGSRRRAPASSAAARTIDARRRVEQAEPLITTGPEVHALHIANYHRVMMSAGEPVLARCTQD